MIRLKNYEIENYTASRVFHAKEKIKSIKQKSNHLKLKTAKIEMEISLLEFHTQDSDFNPISDFSLLLVSHSQSQSPFSLLSISSLSSLKSQPFTPYPLQSTLLSKL